MTRENDDTPSIPEIETTHMPDGVDRRAFMMRSAMIGAVSVLSGCAPSTPEQTAKTAATATPPRSPPRRRSRRTSTSSRRPRGR